MKKIHTAASLWRWFGVAIVCWTALGLFQGRVLFVNDRDHANYLPYAHYFVWAGIDAFIWAVIAPFPFLFARKFPFQRRHCGVHMSFDRRFIRSQSLLVLEIPGSCHAGRQISNPTPK
jgi:hypothetical protein